MTVRKRKKKNKLRGNRTHGGGDTKNRRGGGCRGGRGHGGSKKHKKFNYQNWPSKIRLNPKTIVNAVNLDDLNKILSKLVLTEKALTEKGLIVVDGKQLNIDKLLSRGKLSFKVLVRNIGLSKKAIEKIQSKEGVVEGFQETAQEAE